MIERVCMSGSKRVYSYIYIYIYLKNNDKKSTQIYRHLNRINLT